MLSSQKKVILARVSFLKNQTKKIKKIVISVFFSTPFIRRRTTLSFVCSAVKMSKKEK